MKIDMSRRGAMGSKNVMGTGEEITRIEVEGVVLIRINDDLVWISTTAGEVVLSLEDLEVKVSPGCLFLTKKGAQVNLCHLSIEKRSEVAAALKERIGDKVGA